MLSLSSTLVSVVVATSPLPQAAGHSPRPPLAPITDQPAWEAENEGSAEGSCFGNSVATGDVNGDGRLDIVVGAPRCGWFPQGPSGDFDTFLATATSFSPARRTAAIWSAAQPNGLFSVQVGTINGDRYADVLLVGNDGAALYLGSPSVAEQGFGAPVHVLTTLPSQAVLADIDGDGRSEIFINKRGDNVVNMLRYVDGLLPSSPVVRSFTAIGARSLGDVNGDGTAEVVMLQSDGTAEIFVGCRISHPLVCRDGVSRVPWLKTPRTPIAALADLNHDWLPEFLLSEAPKVGGRAWVHFSNWRSGGLNPVAKWTLQGDPLHINFGRSALAIGDLNGDGRSGDVLVQSIGRVYAFLPDRGRADALVPAYAWPRAEKGTGILENASLLALAPLGDYDRDGAQDFVVAAHPDFGGVPEIHQTRPGRVMVFRGGKIPRPTAEEPAPFLPEVQFCGVAEGDGQPDLTVDADLASRSVQITHADFAADSCEVHEGCVDAPGDRKLLRFTTAMQNLGSAAAILPSPEEAPEIYELDECHGHYHIRGFGAYELLDSSGHVVVRGHKEGFFLVDVQPYCIDAGPSTLFGDNQGLSAGWADVYNQDVPCQWIDITGLADGDYVLRVSVDTLDVVAEGDVWPNFVEVALTLQGDEVHGMPM